MQVLWPTCSQAPFPQRARMAGVPARWSKSARRPIRCCPWPAVDDTSDPVPHCRPPGTKHHQSFLLAAPFSSIFLFLHFHSSRDTPPALLFHLLTLYTTIIYQSLPTAKSSEQSNPAGLRPSSDLETVVRNARPSAAAFPWLVRLPTQLLSPTIQSADHSTCHHRTRPQSIPTPTPPDRH
jgi:hypothetical protein